MVNEEYTIVKCAVYLWKCEADALCHFDAPFHSLHHWFRSIATRNHSRITSTLIYLAS